MGNPNPSPETRFQPGQSGNPGGKTAEHVRMEREAAEMAAKMRHAMLSSMQEKLQAGIDPVELMTGEAIRLFKDSEDRAHGSPKAAVDHTSSDGSMTPVALNASALSDGALREIMVAARATSEPDEGGPSSG